MMMLWMAWKTEVQDELLHDHRLAQVRVDNCPTVVWYELLYICCCCVINSDKWFIWLDWNNIIIHSIGPRLIVMSQAIWDRRVLKFFSSGWDGFKSLGVAQTVCHWRVSFFWQQIVQAGRFAQHTAPEEPLSQLHVPRLKRVLSSKY